MQESTSPTAVLSKDLELQVRRLRFKGSLEREYQEEAALDRNTRVRLALLLYFLIFGLSQAVALVLGEPVSGSDQVGYWTAHIARSIVTIVAPIALFIGTFFNALRPKMLSGFIALLLAGSLWFFYANSGTPMPPERADLAIWFLSLLHTVIVIFVVSAMRAPTWPAAMFSVSTWAIVFWAHTHFMPGESGLHGGLFFFLVAVLMLILGSYFNETSDRRSFLYRKLLNEERDRLQVLLVNVLPAPIAERLKNSSDVIAEYHPSATVLFADLVDFTPYAASRQPGEVVAFLNEVFSRFDEVVERLGLEKIKTVGDAYMVAGGLPTPRPDHLQAVADLALEMRGIASALGVEMRIGIHTGPVIAGVIGTKKYLYDLWGDTVNTAARMESHGVPGKIQLSAAAAEGLREGYELSDRGEVDVKGLGLVRAYVLERRKVQSVVVS